VTDAEALEKAKKLKVLTEQGATEGERNAARTVLAKFLLRYPQIKPLLDAHPHAAPHAAPPPPRPRPPGPDASGAFGFPPWQGGFQPSGKAAPPRPVGGFMGGVWDFIQNAAESLREGMSLRERVRDVVAVDTVANSRTLTFRVSIPVRDLEDLLDYTGPSRDDELATILASLVRTEFLTVLASMDTDDAGL